MFANCTALKRIDLDGIHQENNIDGYDFSGMFDNCANLNSLALADCSKQSYSEVLKCSGLTSLYLGDIDMRTFYLPPLPDGYVWKDKYGKTFTDSEELDGFWNDHNTFTRELAENSESQG